MNAGRYGSLLALSLLVSSIGVGQESSRYQQDAEAIRAVGEAWQEAYAAGDFDRIPELYTEDTLVMPRGRPAISGRDQLRRSLGGLAGGREVAIDLIERELVVMGDVAWFVSEFKVTYGRPEDAEPQRTEHGRSLIIYKRGEDGQWRVHRDMDSPAPAPPTEAAPAPAEAAAVPEDRSAAWRHIPVFDPSARRTAVECDTLAALRYDRDRLSAPVGRAMIDVERAIMVCERDLAGNPDDPRLLFHLGRLHGYREGGAEKARMYREASARLGYPSAIFLLAYIDWLMARDVATRCEAASRMQLAADRGNYSARLTLPAWAQQGRLADCAIDKNAATLLGYLDSARPDTDGYFEQLLVDHLRSAYPQ